MPVAERQIIEPGPARAIRRDHVGGDRVFRKALDRAMGEADADGALRRRRAVHPFGEVAARPARRAGRGQQDDVCGQADRASASSPARHCPAHHAAGRAPQLLRQQRIVIAGQQDPAQRRIGPSRPAPAADIGRRRRLGVECIAGEQDVIRPVRACRAKLAITACRASRRRPRRSPENCRSACRDAGRNCAGRKTLISHVCDAPREFKGQGPLVHSFMISLFRGRPCLPAMGEASPSWPSKQLSNVCLILGGARHPSRSPTRIRQTR